MCTHELVSWVCLLCNKHSPVGKKDCGYLQHILDLDGKSIEHFITQVISQRHHHKAAHHPFQYIAKQVVWCVGDIIEGRLCHNMITRLPSGALA